MKKIFEELELEIIFFDNLPNMDSPSESIGEEDVFS